MLTTPMTLILMIGCLAAGVVGIVLVILSAMRDRTETQPPRDPVDGAIRPKGTARSCPRCLQFSPSYAKYCAHCGFALDSGA